MSVTLWPWRRPTCPPHFLITKPKHIKKTPKSLCHQPKHSHCQKRKQSLQRPFTEQSGSASAHLLQCKGSQNNPDPKSPNTHSLFSLPSSGIAGVALITPVQMWLGRICYPSLAHTGQKIHLLGFALNLDTDYGWEGSSCSSRAPHWDHSSNIPPGTAFLWQSSSWTGNCNPSEPEGTTGIFSSSWIHQKHTRRSSRTLGWAEELGMEVREPGYLRHLLIANTSLRTALSPTFRLVVTLRRVFRDAPCA